MMVAQAVLDYDPQHLEIDRLRQVVVGAEPPSEQLAISVAKRREKDEGMSAKAGPADSGPLERSPSRQFAHRRRQDEIGPVPTELLQYPGIFSSDANRSRNPVPSASSASRLAVSSPSSTHRILLTMLLRSCLARAV